jgi:hypothetical protein
MIFPVTPTLVITDARKIAAIFRKASFILTVLWLFEDNSHWKLLVLKIAESNRSM